MKSIENNENIRSAINKIKKPESPLKKTAKKNYLDVVSGKELACIYFDINSCVDKIPCDEGWIGNNFYIPAYLLKNDEASGLSTVKLPNGEVYKVNNSNFSMVNPQDEEGIDDILKLHEFSEMSLLNTLRVRYNREEIYTNVGPILISINPYKKLKDLYTDDKIIEYHNDCRDKSPHLFVIAENAYSYLMQSISAPRVRNQAIIISGESGAGKTESTKIIMSYLARITVMDNFSSTNVIGEIEQRVLNTNPILEAFGNAKTLRNDNSSRFGKFIKIQFDSNGKIVGALIEKYLLEKTRVQHQLEGERNFHIFYQMLRGLSKEEKSELGINFSVDDFAYLTSSSESINIKDFNDKEDFKSTRSCLESVGIRDQHLTDILKLLYGILQLGNIGFLIDESGDDTVGEVDELSKESLQSASLMFGLDPKALLLALTKRSMHVNGSTIVKSQSFEQAIDKRDSFSKAIYSMLFTWLIDQINSTISCDASSWGYIGVLDIYGFENFDNANGFEQLLINYANEKLQNHFNKHIFQIEQQEYESEGIDWSYIAFNDNQACVDLIEGKPNGKSGIFQTLDDALASSRGDINSAFIAQLNLNWGVGNHSNFKSPRFNSDKRFGIVHYAGEVYYEVSGFAEKNRDGITNDMKELFSTATNNLLQKISQDLSTTEANTNTRTSLSASSGSSGSNNSKSRRLSPKPAVVLNHASSVPKQQQQQQSTVRSRLKEDSISKQFSSSLRLLYNTLDSIQPHFVRCIKPNNKKLGGIFQSDMILQQLKYAGMMETIRIRQQGYALRQCHADFYVRYLPLSPGSTNLRELVVNISKDLGASEDAWQVGNTKIFFRRSMSMKLENLLYLRYSSAARKIQLCFRYKKYFHYSGVIQKYVRRYLAKKKYLKAIKSVIKIQSKVKAVFIRTKFKKNISRIIKCQSYCRRILAKKFIEKLKNPYNRMCYSELMSLITQTQDDINQEYSVGEFFKCEKLQDSINQMKCSLKSKPIPEYIPTSHIELEVYLLEAKLRFDYAMRDKNFHLCPDLQSRMKNLEAFNLQFPSPEEIESEIEKVKTLLEKVILEKDFKKCNELKSKLLGLEKKKAEIVTSLPLKKLCINSLSDKKKQLEDEIKQFLAQNDFHRCDLLQSKVDLIDIEIQKRNTIKSNSLEEMNKLESKKKVAEEIENYLLLAETLLEIKNLEFFVNDSKYKHLTYQELIIEISKLDLALKSYTETKNFIKCGEIQNEIDIMKQEINNKLPVEESTVVVVEEATVNIEMTYDEVIKELDTLKTSLQNSLESRNFSACQSFEEKIKILEEELKKFPPPEKKFTSRKEIESELSGKRKELDLALSNRDFKTCDMINSEIKSLEEKLQLFPSISSLKEKIITLEASLAELISKREFSKCDEIESELRRIKSQYDVLVEESKEEEKEEEEEVVECDITPITDSSHDSINEGSHNIISDQIKTVDSLNETRSLSVPESNTISSKKISNVPPKVLCHCVSSSVPKSFVKGQRCVSKLRPKTPFSFDESVSVYEAAKEMSENRVDAVLIVDSNRFVTGILTDNDMTRRIVSKRLDFHSTKVKDIMTKDPKFVSQDDSALDALEMMIDNGFRHIPVLGSEGKVVGMLDIAKCIHDAISVLEIIQDESEQSEEGTTDLSVAMSEILQSSSFASKKSQLEAIQALMNKMFGSDIPTLDDLFFNHQPPKQQRILSPNNTVFDAALEITNTKKGILITQESSLIGILTPKDILNRVIAKGLNPETVSLHQVMTSNPESVSSDLNLIDALKEMHNQKYQHLPVKKINQNRILGIVDMMELIKQTAGGSQDGSKGWRMFFNRSFEINDERDRASLGRGDTKRRYSISRSRRNSNASDCNDMSKSGGYDFRDSRPVSKLRAKMPVINYLHNTLYEVAVSMNKGRSDASLILGKNNEIAGIITDSDITRKVISKYKDPSTVLASEIMTKDPKIVSQDDSALDALEMMIDNGFRHIPVLGSEGKVVGMLDIAKCIHDAISVLETIQDESEDVTNDYPSNDISIALTSTLQKMAQSKAGNKNKNQIQTIQKMLEKLFGENVPTLRSILCNKKSPSLRSNSTVREASILMSETRKAVIVCDDAKLVGIFTPKDLLNRVVTKNLSPDVTSLSSVMTPNPDCFNSDLTILDSLKEMHDQKYLHLPVRDEISDEIMGVVDVMELLSHSAGDGETERRGWRHFFKGAMDLKDDDNISVVSSKASSLRDNNSMNYNNNFKFSHASSSNNSPENINNTQVFRFKFKDENGHLHCVRCPVDRLKVLIEIVAEELNISSYSAITLTYLDDDKDLIKIDDDKSLTDAISYRKSIGSNTLKIIVSTEMTSNNKLGKLDKLIVNDKSSSNSNGLLIKAIGVVAICSVVGFVILRSLKE